MGHRPQDTGELGARRAGVPGTSRPNSWSAGTSSSGRPQSLWDKLTDYAVSGDGERIVVRHQDAVTVQPSTKKVEDDDADKVTVDLTRLRFQVDQQAEWTQMFDETCRLMSQQFWRSDMDGVQWDAVVERYRPWCKQHAAKTM